MSEILSTFDPSMTFEESSYSQESPPGLVDLITPELQMYIEDSYNALIAEGKDVYKGAGLPELTDLISSLPSEAIQIILLHAALQEPRNGVKVAAQNLLKRETLSALNDENINTGIFIEDYKPFGRKTG